MRGADGEREKSNTSQEASKSEKFIELRIINIRDNAHEISFAKKMWRHKDGLRKEVSDETEKWKIKGKKKGNEL